MCPDRQLDTSVFLSRSETVYMAWSTRPAMGSGASLVGTRDALLRGLEPRLASILSLRVRGQFEPSDPAMNKIARDDQLSVVIMA